MTPDELKAFKTSSLKAIRDYHRLLINDLGIPETDFNMKMPFYSKTGEMVVGIFASEFNKEKGFFFELITRDLQPADPNNRVVYRIAPSSEFEEEYELNEKGSYLVPISELRVVNVQSVAISKSSAVTSSDSFALASKFSVTQEPVNVQAYNAPAAMQDAPYSDMTIRDYYAIQTNKPVSAKNWLNDLIKSNK